MSTNNKLQTILQANSVFALFAMMGYHVVMTVGTDDCTYSCEVTVFWKDDTVRELIGIKSHGCLRDGDAYSEVYHTDASLPGGWTTFEFFYK